MPTGNGTATKSALRNLSQIAEEYGIERATAKKRLRDAGFVPHASSTEKETLYIVTAALVSALRPNGVLESRKTAKLDVENEIKTIQLQKLRGELAPVDEFADITNQIVGTLYKKIVLNMPGVVAKKVRAAKSESEGAQIIANHAKKVFNELRENHERFIGKLQ